MAAVVEDPRDGIALVSPMGSKRSGEASQAGGG